MPHGAAFLEQAAQAINDLCRIDGQPVVNEVTTLAAAAVVWHLYRRGPQMDLDEDAILKKIEEGLKGILEARGYGICYVNEMHKRPNYIDDLTVEYLAVAALSMIWHGHVEIDDNGNPRMPLKGR